MKATRCIALECKIANRIYGPCIVPHFLRKAYYNPELWRRWPGLYFTQPSQWTIKPCQQGRFLTMGTRIRETFSWNGPLSLSNATKVGRVYNNCVRACKEEEKEKKSYQEVSLPGWVLLALGGQMCTMPYSNSNLVRPGWHSLCNRGHSARPVTLQSYA